MNAGWATADGVDAESDSGEIQLLRTIRRRLPEEVLQMVRVPGDPADHRGHRGGRTAERRRARATVRPRSDPCQDSIYGTAAAAT